MKKTSTNPTTPSNFTFKKAKNGVRSFIPSNHPYIKYILEICNQSNAEITLKRGLYSIKW